MNPSSSRNWRDDAIDESLRGFNYENHMEALVASARGAQPTWPLLVLDADRTRTLEFLESECQNKLSLLSASLAFVDEDEPADDLWAGWFAVEWGGNSFEIAFLGGNYNNRVLCLAPQLDEKRLSDFAHEVHKFALRPTGRSLIHNTNWENSPELDAELGKVSWDDVILPVETIRGLREAVESFFAHREMIAAFGFAWKRGILLVGPPGTGKTMVCKAAATALPSLPFLYVRALEGYNPIARVFNRARDLAPCILAFEDIDGFVDDSNRTVFLNEMDGFQSNEGILIIASSNHPGKIDEALLKRPSRFDRVFHIGLPELSERQRFCERVLATPTLAALRAPDFDALGLSERVAAKTEGFTPAYLKEAFLAAALSRAQQGARTLDNAFSDAVLAQVEELRAHLKRVKNPDALAEMRSQSDTIGFRR